MYNPVIKKRHFSSDGIKGEVNENITPELCVALGKAIGFYITQYNKARRVIIGHDTRDSSSMIISGLASGLTAFGVDVVHADELANSGIVLATIQLGFSFGISVSLFSGNKKMNCIKIFNSEGEAIDRDTENTLDRLISEPHMLNGATKEVEKMGSIKTVNYEDNYYNLIINRFKDKIKIRPKIAVDFRNGALYRVGAKILSEFSSELVVLNDKPNGTNLIDIFDPHNLAKLCEATIGNQCDVGISFSAEGSSMVLIDQEGNILSGDEIVALICLLDPEIERVVLSYKISKTVKNFLKSKGIVVMETDKNIQNNFKIIRQVGAQISGKTVARIIFDDYLPCSDAIYSFLKICMHFPDVQTSIKKHLLKDLPKFCRAILKIYIPREKREVFCNSSIINDFISIVFKKLEVNEDIRVNLLEDEDAIKIVSESRDKRRAYDIAYNASTFIKKQLQIIEDS